MTPKYKTHPLSTLNIVIISKVTCMNKAVKYFLMIQVPPMLTDFTGMERSSPIDKSERHKLIFRNLICEFSRLQRNNMIKEIQFSTTMKMPMGMRNSSEIRGFGTPKVRLLLKLSFILFSDYFNFVSKERHSLIV